MFDRFKKFLSAAPKQPAFATAGESNAIPLVPSKLGGLTDPTLEQKPGLGTRILKGLPGFAAQAATVMGAKTLTTALLSSVSPVALAPVLGGAAAMGVGLGVNQSFKYARERMAEIAKEQGRDITLKTLFKEASLAGIKREASAYAKEVTSKDFWKKAVQNGKWSLALGGALGIADHTDAGHEALQLAKEKAAAAITRVTSINPFQRFAEMVSGAAHADVAPPQQPALPTETVAANTVAQAETPASVDQPYIPLTPMERVHVITQIKGSNTALDKLIARADGGNMQAVKDLAYGLYNGKLGLPVDKETALRLFKVAADGGNAQAINSLAAISKETADHVAKAAVTHASLPKVDLVAPGVSDESRAAAAAYIKSSFQTSAPDVPAAPQAQTPAPAEFKINSADETRAKAFAYARQAGPVSADPLQQFAHDNALKKPPARLADEAARCIMGVGEAGKRTINTLCSMFTTVVTPDDHVLIQSADQSLSANYAPESDQPTNDFTTKARRHFRDNDFLPVFGAQLN